MIDEKLARALCRFLQRESILLSTYVQVIFLPSDNLEEDRKFDATLIDNSYPLVRFTFNKESTNWVRRQLPPDVKPFDGGYILLYIPPNTQRYKEEVSVGPTPQEIELYRRSMCAFIAGWEARKKTPISVYKKRR